MTFQRWAQLGDICASLESVLKKNAVPEEVQSLDRLQSTPPHLDLQQYVPNVMLRLEACDFSTHLNPGIRPILEATLVERCRRLQQSFEEAWYRLQGDSPARHMAEQALQTLHVKRFQEDAAQDLQLLTEILQRYAGETSRNDQIDKSSGSEWTDETRALMERVYQQHPKLEAHEKKLLAEVSGLSLRQISIWVSLHLALTRSSRASLFELLFPCG